MQSKNYPTSVASDPIGTGDDLAARLMSRGVSLERVAAICSRLDSKIYTAPVMSEIEHESEAALTRRPREKGGG